MIPAPLLASLAAVAPSWRPILEQGLQAIAKADPTYLPELAADHYLPTENRLFAAFSLPLEAVRHVLVGEGPYPRAQSATGVCFMDGAVRDLWSEKGLSTQVNRATSLRNFIKMLLVCDGSLDLDQTNGDAMALVSKSARSANSNFIQTLPELQQALHSHGFLLLNATLVFRAHVPPLKEARAWRPFFAVVLQALRQRPAQPLPTLVLWGKAAALVSELPGSEDFPKAIAEHPYNLSFIGNAAMHAFFRPMHLLQRLPAPVQTL